ncbi:NfeD family protein [Paenibacillus puerhi]|uniref:NfeD family protein n=1 Tax=Paenibacillus puerhi TaxID=2692622 RepID=UPI001F32AEA6|nr:nodulation protein NfeD [Paenibacillus puerhi]
MGIMHPLWRKRFNKQGRLVRFLLPALLILGMLIPAAGVMAAPASTPPLAAPIVVIPVEHTIENGLERFLQRAFHEAEELGAKEIILEIDTLGGSVEAAGNIGQLVKESKIPTIAYVRGKAISAGTYIALNANRIAMGPGSSMGAAAVVDATGKEVDQVKIISYWSSRMSAAAELRGRDPLVAQAMVDKRMGISLPQIGREVAKGDILTLTAGEAVKVGYAETLVADRQAVVAFIGGEEHPLVEINLSIAEQLSRWITQPWVSVMLLLIGIAGVAIELFVPGFGIAGILGILGFASYFFGHYIAGFAGVEEIVLFVAGFFLLVMEMFVASFGILGVLGALCLFGGVVLSAHNMKLGMANLGIAFVLALIVVFIFIRVFRKRGVWNRFILQDQLSTQEGYVSAVSRVELVGMKGQSLTPLRPSGTALFGEERLDVVTDGEFISAGSPVVITFVEGSRIVVKPWKDPS